MDFDQFGEDVRNGRVDLERLAGLINMFQSQLDRTHRLIEELESQRDGSSGPKADQSLLHREYDPLTEDW